MLVLCLFYAVVDRAFESWAFSAGNVFSFSEQLHRYHHSPKERKLISSYCVNFNLLCFTDLGKLPNPAFSSNFWTIFVDCFIPGIANFRDIQIGCDLRRMTL